MSEPAKKRTRIKRFILTFTPFFILTLLFIGFNFWPGWLNQINQPTVTEVNSVEVIDEVREPILVEADQVVLETAVSPTSTPQPTPSPQPTLPPDATITLIGPPQASSFPDTSNITFYWNWPLLITENQQFGLILINGDQEQQIATINEQNLGQQYALTIDTETIIKLIEPNTSLLWQIYLINSDSGTILTQSEKRVLSIISQAAQQ